MTDNTNSASTNLAAAREFYARTVREYGNADGFINRTRWLNNVNEAAVALAAALEATLARRDRQLASATEALRRQTEGARRLRAGADIAQHDYWQGQLDALHNATVIVKQIEQEGAK